MNSAHRIRFRLDLSPEDYLAYYRGQARDVSVRAEDGRILRFPAGALQPFVTHEGIAGCFEISFDDNHRLVELVRCND